MNRLELKSVAELQNRAFYIPAYQRGYRWTPRQVEDLLKDILEFCNQQEKRGIYCLQPLVVVRKDAEESSLMDKIHAAKELKEIRNLLKEQWEVVDGQQRLTTIRILLEVLQRPGFYDIEYETRKNSTLFLNNLKSNLSSSNEAEDNIDFYHMRQTFHIISKWKDEQKKEDIDLFLHVLLNQVKFIWYETQEKNPKAVFTRLNIGKISLTNAELIKALLLNKSNFRSDDYSKVRLHQQEIAMEWDGIENRLQSTEFWLFIHKPDYERHTRIDYLFDLIRQKDLLHVQSKENQTNDDLKTFRYFYHFFENQEHREEAVRTIWGKVKELFQTLQEWYDDKELYHYIGYLICIGQSVSDIYNGWTQYSTKSAFMKHYLKATIKKNIPNKDLDNTVYEVDAEDSTETKGGSKRNCLPILLLHNIQTVINQNRVLAQNRKYNEGVFYKFPFHLFKSEGWDVEHIDSNTENKLNDISSQREWLLNAYFGLHNEEIKKEIKSFFSKYTPKKNESDNGKELQSKRDKDFEYLKDRINSMNENVRLSQAEKNKIGNFVLLDSSTNRSYGNAIFPAKRRVIIGKDQGKRFLPPSVDEHGQMIECEEVDCQSSFIPPCTKSVFLKYYNEALSDPNTWNKIDADAYKNNIKITLEEFLT